MTVLVIAEHDNNSIKAATLNVVTAAKAIGGDVHVLVAGANAGAGVNADVRTGANSNVTDEQRMSAMGAAGSSANAPDPGSVEAPGAVKGAVEGTGRTLGNVRDTGEAAGSVVARTGKRATQGTKAEASVGLQGAAGAGSNGAGIGVKGTGKAGAATGGRTGAGVGTDAAAGVKGSALPTR